MAEPTDPRPVPAGRTVRGRLRVPPSKSVTNRYLNLALLARRPLVLQHPLDSEDIDHFLQALEACGFTVERRGSRVQLEPGPLPATADIYCGASGSMFRFVTAALTVLPGLWIVDGVPRLRQRPVGPLVEALRLLGARIECLDREGFAPLRIHGGTLLAGQTFLDASRSSQYLSALLMACLRAPGAVTVDVPALTSEPYVDITLQAAARFGGHIQRMGQRTFRVQPSDLGADRVAVEGDWSAAAYPAAAAALTGGTVVLEGLMEDSAQGDRDFFAILERLGATVRWNGPEVTITGGSLTALEEDFSSIPDQVPTLAALAPFARGTTRITNVPHLRLKESDRLAAMARELRKAGVPAEEESDGLVIPGVWADADPPTEPVVLDAHDDHRIAMSCALLGLRRPGVAVGEPEAVAKSYRCFWEDLALLVGQD